jgi:hypothetical protein
MQHVTVVTQGIISKATASVRSTVAILADVDPKLTYNLAVELLTEAYCTGHHNSPVINPSLF